MKLLLFLNLLQVRVSVPLRENSINQHHRSGEADTLFVHTREFSQ